MKPDIATRLLWILYTITLFDLIVLEPWGTINAGIGEMPIDGLKVGALSFLLYLGISVLVWGTPKMSPQRFLVFSILMLTMALNGVAAYIYLFRLQTHNKLVIPNDTAIYFSLTSLVFLGLSTIGFLIRWVRAKQNVSTG